MRQLALRLALIVALVASPTPLLIATPAHAATQTVAPCIYQADMAGWYSTESGSMTVEIQPCGTTWITWFSPRGWQTAGHVVSGQRIAALDGYLAMGQAPDQYTGGYLDASRMVGYKAAERGYIQLVTFYYLPSGDVAVYATHHLVKVCPAGSTRIVARIGRS